MIAQLRTAGLWTETRRVDLGTARGRRHLVSGWSADAWDDKKKASYVWGVGRESSLRFDLLQAREIDLRIRARAVPAPGAPPPELEIHINDHHVRTVPLRDRLRRYQAVLPQDWLRAGSNELVFRFDSEVQPPDRGGQTAAGVGFYELELGGALPAEVLIPRPTADGKALLIPAGGRVEYYLSLPAASELAIDRLQFTGPEGGHFSVRVEEDAEPAEEVAVFDSPTDRVAVALGGDRHRAVRLTLKAGYGAVGGGGRAGAVLTHPTIRSPVPGSPAAADGGAPGRGGAKDGKAPSGLPNIVLYVVDTLRADHLGLYGYSQPVSPHMDRFGAEATVFDNAVAQSTWTRASMASIFTGLWPVKHDTNRRYDVLAPEAVTLAELLRTAGYYTVAIAKNENITPTFGFDQGFDDFRALWNKGDSDQINDRAEKWLNGYSGDKPFFLYLHTVDPHAPYEPPAPYRQRFASPTSGDLKLWRPPGPEVWQQLSESRQEQVVSHLLGLYDGEIAFNDFSFGELLQLLATRGLYEEAVIILVSDHGEEFFDHGTWQHGKNLFAENLNIPLVIRFPDRGQGTRVADLVQHVDIMPTVLDYLGLEVPASVQGRSLLGALRADRTARSAEAEPPAFSYLHLDGRPHMSVIDGEWKLIQHLEQGTIAWSELYHRATDPTEARNVLLDHPILAGYLASLLEARLTEGSQLTASQAVLDERMEAALRALGYLN